MENTIFEEFENEESMEDDEVDLSQAEDIDVEKNFEQVRFNCTDTLKLYLQEIGQYSLLSKEDETLLLVNAIEYKEDIDLERAKKAEERARRRLESKSADVDIKRAKLALTRALVRNQVSFQK